LDWTDGIQASSLKSTATSNPESTHQHRTTTEDNQPILQDTINQDEQFLKLIGVTLKDPMVDINTSNTPQTSRQPSLLDAPLSMEVSLAENILLTPITTVAKKRPTLTSTSSSPFPDSSSLKSLSQENISKELSPSKPNLTKISQPKTKIIKRNKSIENLISQLDEILEPTKTSFEEMPNKKINFKQFKYIIENSSGVPNPASILEEFNISSLEMIQVIENIKPKIKTQSMKNRLKKLGNPLIDNALSTEPTQTE